MSHARVFVPQEAVESWLTGGRAELTQDSLTLDGQAFALTGAVRFLSEVAGGGDLQQLVGCVKTHTQLEQLGAEHTGGAVLLGNDAYEVVEGYALTPVAESTVEAYPQLVRLFKRP